MGPLLIKDSEKRDWQLAVALNVHRWINLQRKTTSIGFVDEDSGLNIILYHWMQVWSRGSLVVWMAD
jgi:hypothetical protein